MLSSRCQVGALASAFNLCRINNTRSVSVGIRHFHAASPKLDLSRPEISASPLFNQIAEKVETAVEKKGKKVILEGEKAQNEIVGKEYRFSTANFKGSPKKLRFISKQIAGLPLEKAIVQMEFSPKRSSNKILHNLTFLRKNAELQKGMDPKKMYVAQAWVGKGQYLKRVQPHSRGRHGVKHHPSAHMKFIIKEIEEQPDLGRARRRKIHRFTETKKVWNSLGNNKPVYNPKPYYNW